ncbi:MAG: cyclase family protein [Proteobacteria bacterium]|nr:cyclase family protein [Pseudomonadota bacterium]
MCNACIIEGVRQTVQSRRSFFAKSAAAGAAALAASMVSAKTTLAQSSGKTVDLTHTYDDKFPTFDGKPGILFDKMYDFKKDGYNLYKLTIFEHTGTHIDAPGHFAENGTSVADLDAQSLICPLCIVDIKAKAKDDVNATVAKADIEAWVSANGEIPKGACVAMNSGWGPKVSETSFRNTPDGKLAFPGFSKEATDYLAELGAAAIAVDTMSLDPGNSADFAVHYSWLPSGRYGIENIANLDALPAKGATVFVGAPKHRGGTGGPARVLATF